MLGHVVFINFITDCIIMMGELLFCNKNEGENCRLIMNRVVAHQDPYF